MTMQDDALVDVPSLQDSAEPARSSYAITGPDALAAAYVQSRDRQVRETLVNICAPLVRGVASDYRNPTHGEDLIQVGFLGLLNAIEHFDPRRGTPFLAFARHFVHGEIRHYLRDHNGVVRRPRWMERVTGQIDQAVGAHLSLYGRYPGLESLADSLNMDVDGLVEIFKTRQVIRTLSLDAETDEGQPSVDPDRSRQQRAVTIALPEEDRLAVMDALERLNPVQRSTVFYIYFTDLTQAETASRLGVSQKHISRVLAIALAKLRQMLAPMPPDR
jgi:RNA polymerase sigma-B factor